jgi:hypothetical protein
MFYLLKNQIFTLKSNFNSKPIKKNTAFALNSNQKYDPKS